MAEKESTKLPELMTVKELIQYLRCCKNTAYQIIHANDFPSIRILNKWYINKDELPEWIKRQEKELKYESRSKAKMNIDQPKIYSTHSNIYASTEDECHTRAEDECHDTLETYNKRKMEFRRFYFHSDYPYWLHFDENNPGCHTATPEEIQEIYEKINAKSSSSD